MNQRPERPLVVKCQFDGSSKRITFTSARNCSYDLLRHRVEQCYSLYATSYSIAYKDDDGEITDITTDADLTEAIVYFQAGSDDPPISSGASILSGHSIRSRKITLRVHITVDYDGPSLSDTSSLVSVDEYKQRNGSQQSFSFGAPSEFDEDAVTISSKDHIAPAGRSIAGSKSQVSGRSWDLLSEPVQAGPSTSLHYKSDHPSDPFSDQTRVPPPPETPPDPDAVFERLKLEESSQDDASSIQHETRNLYESDRGAAWLRDQNARTIKNMLGGLPQPSISSGSSSILEGEGQRGDLALEQDPRGNYYYAYTSSSSRESGVYEIPQTKPRPSSRNLNWLAAQQAASSHPDPDIRPSPPPSVELAPSQGYSPENHSINDIPRELLQFLPLSPPPADTLTDCSECGVLLDAIRYVCVVCGPKRPVSQSNKGKGRSMSAPNGHGHPPDHNHNHLHAHEYSYPPRPMNGHHHYSDNASSSSRSSSGSYLHRNGSADSSGSGGRQHIKPLPRIPGASLPPITASSSQATLVPPPQRDRDPGYELCAGCLEDAGVNHAITGNPNALPAGPSSPNPVPSSPEDASQWRRLAPQKGKTRHAYREMVWGHLGWKDVEQDDSQVNECSTCAAVTSRQRYKCVSCKKFNLCRGCYSQVHDLHPSHAFVALPDEAVPEPSESDQYEIIPPDIASEGEKSMVHPGVRCAHCMQEIVGARFHCVVCDNIDICANCESAGLPGNLDSSDGGHTSSHISIKIPYPLETDEVEQASRRANNLWQGRDAASVGLQPLLVPKANSVISGYARTIISSGSRPPDNDHHMYCNGCGGNIVGVRYQCANCPSQPQCVSLCENCEPNSYAVHDPSHVFFKLPRPVQKPLASPYAFLPRLYKPNAGPPPGMDPQTYLANLKHSVAVCDRCMSSIQGVWFRCAYCGADYCDACEAVDTHNDSHCFMAFKSPVDMQALKAFTPVENPPPIIPYPIYR
uniref:Uncharacterized protein n=1 Tax=Mycena chlorophos TaxID=658473 RepID=A0ABQ0L7B4_MYCCL|nr:predicted protein [Mycena chlorophos]